MRRTFTWIAAAVFGLTLSAIAIAARNSSGTYSLPTGNPVIAGTTITTTWANNTLGDLGGEITNSLSRDGKGAMRAPLRTPDGTVSAPAHSYSNETGSGLYRLSAGHQSLAVLGVDAQGWSTTGSTIPGTLSVGGTTTLTGNVVTLGTLGVGGATTRDLLLSSHAVSVPAANSTLSLLGNRDTADSEPDVIVGPAVDRTGTTARSGPIFAARSDTIDRFVLDAYGEPSVQGGYPLGVALKSTANQTATGSFVDVTGLSFPVVANGIYYFQAAFVADNSSPSGGVQIQFTGPASPAQVDIAYFGLGLTGTAVGGVGLSGYATAFSSAVGTTSLTDTSRAMGRVIGLVQNGANGGTVQMQFRRGGSNGTATLYKGAFLIWRRVG